MTSAAPTSADTSVVVAALLPWHPAHAIAREALREVSALPAHVMLEAYSVLTRLPAPHRITPLDAGRALGALHLPLLEPAPSEHRALVAALSAAGVGGGATYDALVATTAQSHGHTLLTLDRRALRTYDIVGARVVLLT